MGISNNVTTGSMGISNNVNKDWIKVYLYAMCDMLRLENSK
jgi:hypothetical protein